MQVSAQAKNIRTSPTKVRLVADLIRNMEVNKALAQLPFVKKGSKEIVFDLLNSAVANAENTFNCKRENLYISKIFVDADKTLKRWRARAFGRSAAIRKRGAQMTIVLSEIVPTEPKERKVEAVAAPISVATAIAEPLVTKATAKESKIQESEMEKRSVLEKSFDSDNIGKHDTVDKPRSEVKTVARKVFRRKSGQ